MRPFKNATSNSVSAAAGVATNSTCASTSGSEYTYAYQATCDGAVTVTLTKTSSTTGYLDLFVLDGDQVCAGASCLAHDLMSSGTSEVTFEGTKGKHYRIVVDGYAGYSGNYTLETTCECAATTETDCSNKIDDDKDGKLDCQDSDCVAAPECAGPTNCVDDYALQCGGYDAWSNDAVGSTSVVSGYQCVDGGEFLDETGSEYAYEFIPDCTGTATIKLTKNAWA